MRQIIIAAAVVSMLALSGCVSPTTLGSASIYVKDAPTDEFSEIHVVFTEVQVHYAGNGTDNDTSEEDGEWVTLFENANGTDVDLLAANGSAAAFLGEADLQAGKYTQIRIIVESAYGVDADGAESDITVSSGTLKIVRSFDVIADEETRIVVDYDLDRSLKETGQGAWRLTPVVGKVHVDHVDDESSGEDAHEEGEIDDDAVEE